jgi:hypothetical protein
MRFSLRLLLPLALAAFTAGACAQASSAPAGWPRAMPLPAALAGSGTTRTIVQPPAPVLDPQVLAKRFQIAGNEVYDRKTELTWQRCDFGQSWDEANGWCRGVKRHATAEGFAEATRADAAGWRVPTIDELSSLLEIACAPLPKDATPVFPEIERSAGLTYYLSSSPSAADGVMASQCFGGAAMTSGLGRKYTAITHLVRSGAIAGH